MASRGLSRRGLISRDQPVECVGDVAVPVGIVFHHNVDIKELMLSRVPKGKGIRDNRDEKQETHFMTKAILCLGGRDRNKT